MKTAFQEALERSGTSQDSSGVNGLGWLFLTLCNSLDLEPLAPGDNAEHVILQRLNAYRETGGYQALKRVMRSVEDAPPADPKRRVRIAKAEAKAALTRVTEAEKALTRWEIETEVQAKRDKARRRKEAEKAVKDAEHALADAEAKVKADKNAEAAAKVAPVTRAKFALNQAKQNVKTLN